MIRKEFIIHILKIYNFKIKLYNICVYTEKSIIYEFLCILSIIIPCIATYIIFQY